MRFDPVRAACCNRYWHFWGSANINQRQEIICRYRSTGRNKREGKPRRIKGGVILNSGLVGDNTNKGGRFCFKEVELFCFWRKYPL